MCRAHMTNAKSRTPCAHRPAVGRGVCGLARLPQPSRATRSVERGLHWTVAEVRKRAPPLQARRPALHRPPWARGGARLALRMQVKQPTRRESAALHG
eukprot:scaffold82734_cov26-Tisochrysis_lutea.AAC.1